MTRFEHLFSRSALTIYLSVGALFTILTLLIAVDPAIRLKHEDATLPIAAVDAAVARGRLIYMAEGCGYCHSQLVRPALIDTPYGRPSRAADYAGATPPLVGTQRNGPDLSAVGERQTSHVWNLYHLFNPRSMVPASIMPAYPWYFDVIDKADVPAGTLTLVLGEPFLPAGKVAMPKAEALDLVAYLLSVKQR
ncbi:MAG: cbb3-type cytochrome c oxidase subunit II [Rhizobiales bacterium]|nr:cbb3-type cytochrome c oxidase subunit II [Hyphomicrobiales bacterium]